MNIKLRKRHIIIVLFSLSIIILISTIIYNATVNHQIKNKVDSNVSYILHEEDNIKNSLISSNSNIDIFIVIAIIVIAILIMYKVKNKKEHTKSIDMNIQPKKYIFLTEDIIDGCWQYNVNDKTWWFSKNIFDILDYEENELLMTTDSILNIVHKDDMNELVFKMKEIIRTEIAFKHEYRIRNKSGNYIWVLINGNCHYVNNNNKIISGIFTNITERKEYEYALKVEKQKVEKAMKIRDEFLTNISHEIRTPLNTIVGYTEVLLNEIKDPHQVENMNLIKDSSKYLLTLLNDIIDISKIHLGELSLNIEDFIIKDSYYYLMNVFNLKAKEKGLDFISNYDEDLPIMVKADETRINQILSNLLGNAIKFTEKGEIRFEVRLTKKKDNKVNVLYEIADTGIGMSRKHFDKIFNTFEQGDSSSSKKYKGAGIGLTIVKRLVRLMDGKIDVESILNVGSTFKIFLSFEIIQDDDLLEDNVSRLNTIIMPNDIRILVAEDNDINQMLIIDILAMLGVHNVDMASNGYEILEFLKEKEYDILITDIQMPEMDGIVACKEIRNKKEYNDFPIVALTANVMKEQLEEYYKVGMNDYISKPLEVKEFVRTLNKFL
jgi:PAS domain S-box-containing protein